MDQTGIIEFPSFLPYPQQSGHQQNTSNKMKAVDVENGIGKLYYNPDLSRKANVSFILNMGQYKYWKIWFSQVLLNGKSWFLCPLYGVNETIELKPVRISPQSQIQETPLSGGLNISIKLQLDVAPTEQPPVSILAYYPWAGGETGFNEITNRLHIIVNTSSPEALTIPEL